MKLKKTECNVRRVKQIVADVQDVRGNVEIVKARIINTETEIQKEIKGLIIDIEQVDLNVRESVNSVEVRMDAKVMDTICVIKEKVDEGYRQVDKKLSLEIESITKAVDNALLKEINEGENKLKEWKTNIIKEVIVIANAIKTDPVKVEMQQDILLLQNAVESIKLNFSCTDRMLDRQPQQLMRHRSNETIISEVEEILPKKRGKLDNTVQQQSQGSGRGNDRHKYDDRRHEDNDNGRSRGRQNSPDNYYDAYSYQEFDEVEKRESARLSRHMKQENAPLFNGNNTTAPQFIADAEVFFKGIDIRQDKGKLRAMINFLKDSLLDWWKMTVCHTNSWESFKEKFLTQYFGDYKIQKMESEWISMNCRPHWNVEKFALKALKLQEILKKDLSIDKQCHNVIQKLPLSLRDYLSLLRFSSGTDFMRKLKDAMRVKDYAIPTPFRTSQRDDTYKGRYKEYEDSYESKYPNKNRDSRDSYYRRDNYMNDRYRKTPYKRTNGYSSENGQKRYDSDNSNYGRRYDQNRGYKRRNDSYGNRYTNNYDRGQNSDRYDRNNRYDDRNDRGQNRYDDRGQNRDRYDDRNDRSQNNGRKDERYYKNDDEYRPRDTQRRDGRYDRDRNKDYKDSDSYDRSSDKGERDRKDSNPSTRKPVYKSQEDTYPNNKRSIRGRDVRGMNVHEDEESEEYEEGSKEQSPGNE